MRVTRFRCYPNPRVRRGLFVRVLVFDRRCDLLAFWRAQGNRGPVRAWCSEVRRYYRNGRRGPLIATVCLWRGEIGIGTVAHEFLHATLAWARRVRIDGADLTAPGGVGVLDQASAEERLAYVHGAIVKQFVAGAYACGLYVDRKRSAAVARSR